MKRKLFRKENAKNLILLIIIIILVYNFYGVYKESKIRVVNDIKKEKLDYKKEEVIEDKKHEIDNLPNNYFGFDVIAKLEIPKINLETYILKEFSMQAMKISVTKFYGPNPNEIGNFCITGHNYKRENMFSKLKNLEIGDSLYLSDNINGKYEYEVYDMYRVSDSNTQALEQTTSKREITLITCVNYTQNRLIVKAVEK